MRIEAVGRFLKGHIPYIKVALYSHEFTHTLQFLKQKAGWAEKNFLLIPHISTEKGFFSRLKLWHMRKNMDGGFFSKSDTDYKEYYSQAIEIQARMNEIVPQGYCQWQTMPVSKLELWAALYNAGIDAPEHIESLLHDTEDGQSALQKFALLPGIRQLMADAVSDFNRLQTYIHNEATIKGMWDNYYPYLYGELIEHYGDIPGRARMGLGLNPKRAIAVFHEAETLSDEKEAVLDEEDILRLARSIPPELASAFINNFVRVKNSHYIITEHTRENLYLIIEALVKDPAVQKELFEKDQAETYIFSDCDSTPPHLNALGHHDFRLFELLMQNGADINQKYTFIDIKGESYSQHDIRSIRDGTEALLNRLDKESEKSCLLSVFSAFSKTKKQHENQYFKKRLRQLIDLSDKYLNRSANSLTFGQVPEDQVTPDCDNYN
ncbi:MAG: hypothetical protein ACK4VI_04105 [Alphaproteobacteria bacterium]